MWAWGRKVFLKVNIADNGRRDEQKEKEWNCVLENEEWKMDAGILENNAAI